MMENVACPVCKISIQSKPVEIWRQYKIYRCSVCDLVFSEPMKSPGSEWYMEYADYRSRDLTLSPGLNWNQKEFLENPPIHNGTLLDIGCGVGSFVNAVSQLGYEAMGIDFDRIAVEEGKKKFGANLLDVSVEEFVRKFPDKKFDVITFFEVLEHLDNLDDFMATVRKLVKSDGYIALSVPNRQRIISRNDLMDKPPNHFTRWNRKSLLNFLTKNNFKVISLRDSPYIDTIKGYLEVKLTTRIIYKKSLKASASGRLLEFRNSKELKILRIIANLKRKIIHSVSFVVFLFVLPLFLLKRPEGINLYALAKKG